MSPIDLRSDTVTQPTDEMRRAMAAAEVGDDVFGDDPTVNALEERAAELLGKEAGLFVTSGTMGNLVAQLAHLARGQETIAGAEQPHRPRRGGRPRGRRRDERRPARASGPDGTMDLDEIADAFRDPIDAHEPITGLVAIENTHAHSMGQPLTVGLHRRGRGDRPRHGVPLHVDGARFFNAVVALGVRPVDAGRAGRLGHVLPVKGLACPVGSVVVGSRDFIWRARRAPQAGRRRDAPGRACSPRPGWSPCATGRPG